MPAHKLNLPDDPILKKPSHRVMDGMKRVQSCVYPGKAYDKAVPPYFNIFEGQMIHVEAKDGIWMFLINDLRISSEGFLWIRGKYLYSKDLLLDYPHVMEAMTEHALIQEMALGQKLEICGAGSVFDAAEVKSYRDYVYVHPPIDFRKPFFRFSFDPSQRDRGPGESESAALACSCCGLFYDWGTSHQRFCFLCNQWVHVQGAQPVDAEIVRENYAGGLRELLPALSTIQVMRGRLCQVDENSDVERWSFVGTGLLRSRALTLTGDNYSHLTEEELYEELQQTVLDFDALLEYIRTRQPSLYQCPLRRCTMHI